MIGNFRREFNYYLTREERNQFNYNKRHKIIDGIEYKQCTKCEQWFPMNLDNFYEWEQGNDNLSSRCKSCSIKDVQTRFFNTDSEVRRVRRKNTYHTNKKDKECSKKHSNIRREKGKHAEWLKTEAGKASSKKSTEKRKLKEHYISEKEWRDCKKYFNNECAFCGLPIEKYFKKYRGVMVNQDLQKDHVDDEGSNGLCNCIPSCGFCNSSKHTATFDEWYNENNPRYSEEKYKKIMKWLDEDYKQFAEEKPLYRIFRRKNEGLNTYHYELWSIDKLYKPIYMISRKDKRKELNEDIQQYLKQLDTNQ